MPDKLEEQQRIQEDCKQAYCRFLAHLDTEPDEVTIMNALLFKIAFKRLKLFAQMNVIRCFEEPYNARYSTPTQKL